MNDTVKMLTLLVALVSVAILSVVLYKLDKKKSGINSDMRRERYTPGACVEPGSGCTACDFTNPGPGQSPYTQEDPSCQSGCDATNPGGVLYGDTCLPSWTGPGVKNPWKNSQDGRNDCYQYCRGDPDCVSLCNQINP